MRCSPATHQGGEITLLVLTIQSPFRSRSGGYDMEFGFEVIRLWEVPVEKLLTGGLATLPLAVLGKLPTTLGLEDGLAAVIRQMVVAFRLFQGARAMRESDTYQAILDEGREEGSMKALHRTLLRLGRKRFGEPDEKTRQAICDVRDPDRLEELSERLLDVSTWKELLVQ